MSPCGEMGVAVGDPVGNERAEFALNEDVVLPFDNLVENPDVEPVRMTSN